MHNPRYAGAFFFGRIKRRKLIDGTIKYTRLPRHEWYVLKKDTHEGYITWEDYEDNLRRLGENAQAQGIERKKSPPKEGPALLQGLALCGICGKRMSVSYHSRHGTIIPHYRCQGYTAESIRKACQSMTGIKIDEAIEKLLMESVSPLALEVALQVQDELHSRVEEADRLRRQQVERARYEADLARRRYMGIDPANRFVADSLEADWNDKLRALKEAQQEYEKQCKADQKILNDEQRTQITAIATDFPRLWHDPKTSYREKKRMIRLLIEDVTLTKKEDILIQVRFKGGAVKSLNIPRVLNSWERDMTESRIITLIDKLLDHYNDSEIADILNKRSETSGRGHRFHARIVSQLRRRYGLKSLYDRLRAQNLFTSDELSEKLEVTECTLRNRRKKGMIKSYNYNNNQRYLYEWPDHGFVDKLKEEKQQGTDRGNMALLSNCYQGGAV